MTVIQRIKHFNMKINTAPIQSFSEHALSFNYRISMETWTLKSYHSFFTERILYTRYS